MYEDGRFTAIWNRIAQEHNPSLDLTSRGLQRSSLAPAWLTAEGVPHNKNLPLKLATLQNYSALTNRFYQDEVTRPALSAMATGPNRIWFSSQVAVVRATEEAYAAFVARSESLGAGVLVLHPRDEMTSVVPASEDGAPASISQLPPARPVDVKLKAYRPDELSFQVECTEKGWLLVTDRWSRAWRATVNGRPTDVWGGNFIFRALPVEAGANDVRFTYDAVGFPGLLVLSWSTVLVILAFGLYSRVREGQRPRPSSA